MFIMTVSNQKNYKGIYKNDDTQCIMNDTYQESEKNCYASTNKCNIECSDI